MNKIKPLFTLAVFVSLFGTACSNSLHKNTVRSEVTNIKKNVHNTEDLDLLKNYDKDQLGWPSKLVR